MNRNITMDRYYIPEDLFIRLFMNNGNQSLLSQQTQQIPQQIPQQTQQSEQYYDNINVNNIRDLITTFMNTGLFDNLVADFETVFNNPPQVPQPQQPPQVPQPQQVPFVPQPQQPPQVPQPQQVPQTSNTRRVLHPPQFNYQISSMFIPFQRPLSSLNTGLALRDLSNNSQIFNFNSYISERPNIQQEDRNCSICMLEINNNDIIRVLNNCSHYFHNNCIERWFDAHNTCPLCRNNLSENNNQPQTQQPPTQSTQQLPTQPPQLQPNIFDEQIRNLFNNINIGNNPVIQPINTDNQPNIFSNLFRIMGNQEILRNNMRNVNNTESVDNTENVENTVSVDNTEIVEDVD
jgi:hypothetical protein